MTSRGSRVEAATAGIGRCEGGEEYFRNNFL